MKSIPLPLSKLLAAALLTSSLCIPIFTQAASQETTIPNTQSRPQEQNFSNVHVVVTSSKSFEKTVEDL